MGYLFETRFFNKKYLNYELIQVYGLGKNQTLKICRSLGLQRNSFFKDLKKSQQYTLKKYVENNLLIGSVLNDKKSIVTDSELLGQIVKI